MKSVYRLFTWALVCFAAAFCPVQGQADIRPVEREHFVYYFSDPGKIESADSILNAARLKLAGLLGDTLAYRPSVYLVDDLESFKRAVGGVFPDWGAAAAIPEAGRIVAKSPDRFPVNRPLAELLTHELAHLAVAHRIGLRSVPRWFDEGVAMTVSMEWGWPDNLAMSTTAVFGEFIPLSEIEDLNRFNQSKAQVAYAESYLAVTYLQREYGQAGLGIFLDEIVRGALISDALMAATGSNYRDFEREFQQHLREHFNLTALFLDTMYFWLALAMVVVVGAFLQYRRKRRYYKKWDEEEKLQSTDFDYGDPDRPERADDEDEPWRS